MMGKETEKIEVRDGGDLVACEMKQKPREPKEGDLLSKVGVNLGVTKSTGNYEFIKVDCFFEDYCEKEERSEAFEGLLVEATERLAKYIENFDKHKRTLATGSCVERVLDEGGNKQASKRSRWILNAEMKMHFSKEDYEMYSKILADRRSLKENEAREAIWQLRSGDISFFVKLLEEKYSLETDSDNDSEVDNGTRGEKAWETSQD